jgi:hypothetical protein
VGWGGEERRGDDRRGEKRRGEERRGKERRGEDRIKNEGGDWRERPGEGRHDILPLIMRGQERI